MPPHFMPLYLYALLGALRDHNRGNRIFPRQLGEDIDTAGDLAEETEIGIGLDRGRNQGKDQLAAATGWRGILQRYVTHQTNRHLHWDIDFGGE